MTNRSNDFILLLVLDVAGNMSIKGVNNIKMEAILQASIYKGGNQLAPTITFSVRPNMTVIIF